MSTTYTLIAQAYSCDAYGAGDYNACAAASTPSTATSSPSQTGSTAEPSSSTGTSTANPQTNLPGAEGATGTTQPPSSLPTTVAAKVDGMSWNILLPILLGLALLFALIIFLLKRRKQHNEPPTHFDQPKF